MTDTTWTILISASRMAAMMGFMLPGSWSFVPMRVRIFLGIALGMCCAGGCKTAAPTNSLEMAAAVVTGILVGAAMGLTVRLVFAGVAMAGEVVAQQTGIGLADAMNPEANFGGVAIRRLYEVFAACVFVASGGLAVMIKAGMSATTGGVSEGMFTQLVNVGGMMFSLAVRIAGPVIVTMLCVTLTVGMIQRTMLSVNILTVGVSIRMIAALIVLAGVVAILPAVISGGFGEAFAMIVKEGLR